MTRADKDAIVGGIILAVAIPVLMALTFVLSKY
jgi:hypothetical protein